MAPTAAVAKVSASQPARPSDWRKIGRDAVTAAPLGSRTEVAQQSRESASPPQLTTATWRQSSKWRRQRCPGARSPLSTVLYDLDGGRDRNELRREGPHIAVDRSMRRVSVV